MNPKTHVFAVAVESYQDPAFSKVMYSENDAQKFVEAWQALGVAPDQTVLLVGSQATKTAVQSRLRKFQKSLGDQDRVVFFYAGHGVSLDGEGFLTMQDTLPDDVDGTSVPLGEVLRQLHRSGDAASLFFLDPFHGKMPFAGSFSTNDLKAFCEESPGRSAFISAGDDELSQASLSHRHGIWSRCLALALSGQAKASMGSDGVITTSSLQNYLQDEVPRQARVDGGSQRPRAFGASSEVVVDDLSRLSPGSGAGASIKGSRLVGGSQGRVRSLSGFAKFHKEPDSHTTRFAQFVESLGVKEVEDRTTEIFDRVRDGFKYKRKDLFFDKEGAIKTPDFEVSVRIKQDPLVPNMYLLSNEVTVRNPDVVSKSAFLDVFARYCNSVVIELDGSLNIEAKIDDIEEIDLLADHLEYDAACTEFTLRFPGTDMVLHASPDRLRFTHSGRGDLLTLIKGTQSALSNLSNSRIALGLADRPA